MIDDNAITRGVLLHIRNELDLRGLPLKVCASKAGVHYSTFLTWFPNPGGSKEPQIPSLACLRGLAKALPGDLLSMLVPDGFHIVPDPNGIDFDEFSAGCRAFVDAKERAHHPESEAGRELGPTETADLNDKIVRLRA